MDRALLFEQNVRLARRLADRYYHVTMPGFDFDDVYQHALLGLLDAARRWDPDKGKSFRHYATLRIRGEMIDFLRKQPEATRNAAEPITVPALSLDAPMDVDGDGLLLHETVRDANADDPAELCDMELDDLRAQIGPCWHMLTERERMVLYMRYWEDLKTGHIGELLGVTASRVSQITSAGLLKLRRRMEQAA